MPSNIGSLVVELGVNTAAFARVCRKTTYTASQASKQIGSSLRGIGSALGEIGAAAGQFGGIIGSVFTSAGVAVSKLAREMGGMQGVAGTLKLGAAGAVAAAAAFATASASVIGIAMHAAEAATISTNRARALEFPSRLFPRCLSLAASLVLTWTRSLALWSA